MKKLVKGLALVLAIATVLCLAACGSDKEVVTIATNAEFPPFEYFEGEEMVGAEIDMAYALAEKMGVEIEITHIDFDAALTGAATGKYDMAISGITATDDRRKNMNFSDAYYKASQAIIVTADSDITTAADLADGKIVSCQEGTTGEQYLLDNDYMIQSFKTGSEAITALVAGKVDAVVIDDAVAKALSAEQNGKTKVLDEAMTKEEYAIAIKLGNDEFTAEVNEAIAALKADGSLKEIFAKYDLVID